MELETEKNELQPENMELKVEEYKLKPIKFNFEELKTKLKEKLEKYQGLVVTEENLNDSTKTRKELNDLKNSIEDERKRIKKEWNAPYENFEKQIKELVGLVDKPIQCLDTQIKSFENTRKESKREEIQKFFDENNTNELIKLDMIFDERWLNKGEKIEKIKETILATLGKIETSLNVIKVQQTKYVTNMIDVYLKTLDLASALKEKERLEELEKNANLERIKKQQVEPKQVAVYTLPKTDEECELVFKVVCTANQMRSLREFMINNKIKFSKVEGE